VNNVPVALNHILLHLVIFLPLFRFIPYTDKDNAAFDSSLLR
jgi:hypothetical protein